jgi:hypothetical protein
MAQRKTLTEQQVSLLRWIAAGCPYGVMDGVHHRISVAALRNRVLVTISGRGSTWAAKITDAGQDYLAQLDGPNPPVPRQANVSVTQQLVDDVIAGGGVLRVPRRGWPSWKMPDYRHRALLAMRHGKVPDGKRLTVTVVDRELEIQLVDAPATRAAEPSSHRLRCRRGSGAITPAARQFRERSERHEVSRAQLQRAARIIHAIAVEAEKRRWTARTDAGDLTIIAQEHVFTLHLQEEGVRTRGPWEEAVDRFRGVSRDSYFYRDRELPTGAYDAAATGRLNLELNREWPFRGRQSRWGDRQSWTLEDRLPHLFREIEERIVEAERVAEERRVATERAAEAAKLEAEEHQRRWHVLMERARERLLEDHRAKQLRNEAGAWRDADRLRRYCDAVDTAYGSRPDTAEWLAWARGYVAQIDPLNRPPTMPKPIEATPEALQPYLPEGWSAHGPEARTHRSQHPW